MLSKEYFTYYIILGILLGSIIIPVTSCSTRSPARRRLDGFGPARGAHCGGFAGLARAHTRSTCIGRRRGREPRIVRHLSHPAARPAHPHGADSTVSVRRGAHCGGFAGPAGPRTHARHSHRAAARARAAHRSPPVPSCALPCLPAPPLLLTARCNTGVT